MLKNYLTIALRNLSRNKLHSLINMTGLAIGISACLVIFLIVKYEYGFDRFRKDRERIYRVYSDFSGDFTATNRGVPNAMAGAAKEFTAIEQSTGFHLWQPSVYVADGSKPKKDFGVQPNTIIVGPEFFEVFDDYTWLAGNPMESMGKPFQVVLTEHQAKNFFGTENALDAMNKEIHFRDSLILTVAGIVKDFDERTDLKFDNFISLSTIPNSWLKNNYPLDDWTSTNGSSQFLLKLKEGNTEADLEAVLRKFEDTYRQHHLKNNWKVAYKLQPMADLHYNPALGTFGLTNVANLLTLKLLIVVAFLLLAIAVINFINLETAQAMRRAKEVGVRKVMGSSRKSLVLHFLMHSFVLAFLAALLSVPFSLAAVTWFKDFIPAAIQLDLSSQFTFGFLSLSVLVVGILAGIYPAVSLSSFLPVLALKNQLSANSNQTRTGFVRRALIIFQFTFAQALIIATVVVGWQISFMENKDIGLSKDAVLYFDTPWREPMAKRTALKNEIERLPEVAGVTICSDAAASRSYGTTNYKYNNGKEELHHEVYRKFGDPDFIGVFDIKLLAGRNIHKSDSLVEFLINETYSKALGFKDPQEALGKMLIVGEKQLPIVGVVRDFNYRSLDIAIEPAAIADEEKYFSTIAVKLSTNAENGGVEGAVADIEKTFKKIYPDQKWSYEFLDETVAKFYESQRRLSKLITTATGVAVLISCLGLFGLATFTAAQRNKEIGIRKVLGATVNNILVLLSREFVWLVVIAFIIAAPLSWKFANQWLSAYAYRIPIGWQIYAWTLVSSVVIVIISVAYQALKAAMADPVKSLRYE